LALGLGKCADDLRERYGSVPIVHGGNHTAKSSALTIPGRDSDHRARGIAIARAVADAVAITVAIAFIIAFPFSRSVAFAIAVSIAAIATASIAFALSTAAIAFAVTSDRGADFGGMFGNQSEPRGRSDQDCGACGLAASHSTRTSKKHRRK